MDEQHLNLIWGAEAIAKLIGRTPAQTHYLLRTGKIPAKQIGSRRVISRRTLARFFDAEDDQNAP